MTIRAIWNLIRFQWALLLLATIIGMAVGWSLASSRTAEYTANAEVFVIADSRRSAGDINQAATYARDQAQNFAEVATREMVLEPVIEDADLPLTVGELRSKVSTSVPLNTSIISISATDASATRAADIANGVAKSLSESIVRLVPQRASGNDPVEVESVQRADVPGAPSGTPAALLALLGGLVALFFALVLLGLKEIFRGKVRTAGQAGEITRSPVLGSVSRNNRGSRQLVVLADAPNSAQAEQYRQIRANLQALLTKPERNVFVVTSSVSGEGRTTAAANLAATLAAAGTKVCLVEADLHRPALATSLGLETGLGFAALLTGKAEVHEALQPWGEDGLQVLVAGLPPRNPSELLASREAEAVLTTIRDKFEVTVIDAPPVLPVADAVVLARLFGGAIMVVSERRVRAREAQRAVERMALVGAPILGTIFTLSKRASRKGRSRGGYAGGSAESFDSTGQGGRESEGQSVTKLHHSRGASISARAQGA